MGLEAVARDQYLYRRQGRYYVRRRVPKELVEQAGKDQIVKSLFTSDYRQATSLAIKAAADIERQFDEMRGKIVSAFSIAEPQHRRLDQLPTREIEYIVFTWFRREVEAIDRTASQTALQSDDASAGEGQDFEAVRFELESSAREFNKLALRLSKGGEALVEDDLAQVISRICKEEALASTPLGPAVRGPIKVDSQWRLISDRNGTKYRIFRDLVRRGQIQVYRLQVAEWTGQIYAIDDQDFVTALKPPYRRKRGAVTLSELIEEFKSDPNRKNMRKKLELDYGLLFKAMDEVIGLDKRLSDISRDDCKEVADLLSRIPANATKKFPNRRLIDAAKLCENDTTGKLKPLNEVTITSYLHKMSALFNFACNEERMDRNPAKGLRKGAKKHSAEDRFTFTFAQLNKIFSAPLYSGCRDDGLGWKHKGPCKSRGTRFWIPLIALFHGLRLNEACQLRVADIEKKDGLYVFNVRNSGEHQRVKTNAGHRIVPFHPVFDTGKLDFPFYVQSMKEKGNEYLFPDLKRDSRGYYSDGFQKWFARFLVHVKAKSERCSFHSFRHNWRDALRNAGVPQERVQALGGWKGYSTDEKYGSGLSVRKKRQELAKVKYSELDLSHLLQRP